MITGVSDLVISEELREDVRNGLILDVAASTRLAVELFGVRNAEKAELPAQKSGGVVVVGLDISKGESRSVVIAATCFHSVYNGDCEMRILIEALEVESKLK